MNEKRVQNNYQILYLIASYAVWGVFWGAWGVLLPEVKNVTGATDAMLGKALLGTAIGAVPTMFGTGLLIKRFSKWTLFSGLIFFSASIAALTMVNSPWLLAIVLLFVGASSGALDVIMNSGVAVLESETGKRYFNYAHAAFPIAVIVTSPIVGLARQFQVNITVILLTMSAIIAAVAFASLKLDVNACISEDKAVEKTNNKAKTIFITKAVVMLGVLGMLIHIMENAVEQWGAIYLEDKLLASPSIASLGLTGYMLMLFAGRILAQKIGRGWSERKLLIIAAATAVIGFAIVALLPNKFLVILGFSIAGLGIAPIVPMVFTLVGSSTTADMRIKAISTVTVIAYAGYLICPPIVGYIAAAHNLRSAWILISCIGVLALLMILTLSGIFKTKVSSKQNTSASKAVN